MLGMRREGELTSSDAVSRWCTSMKMGFSSNKFITVVVYAQRAYTYRGTT